MQVTSATVDPVYDKPYVDVDEVRAMPVPHRLMAGGFAGTQARFWFAFPPPERYAGRFIQQTHQLFANRTEIPDEDIEFAVMNGSYVVQTNVGGLEADTTATNLPADFDGSRCAYRVNAEAAKYSRVVASELYGAGRPFGYLFGGSGGSVQVKAAARNTDGVWDGFVPYITGSPNPSINRYGARQLTLRMLNDDIDKVLDAVEPGGDLPLNALGDEQRHVLHELTQYGMNPRAWFIALDFAKRVFPWVAAEIWRFDPTYTHDFWNAPGYLGADPNSSVRPARIQHEATVDEVRRGGPRAARVSRHQIDDPNLRVRLDTFPSGELELSLAELFVLTGPAAGRRAFIDAPDPATRTVGFKLKQDPLLLESLAVGARIRIDNSFGLAAQYHFRHQIPERGDPLDYPIYEQYRNADGAPRYVQRPVLVGPLVESGRTGGPQDGRFAGKMILVQTMLDEAVFPWEADWYRSAAVRSMGQEQVDANFRLWYIDNARHINDPGEHRARLIDYWGVIQQALSDVASWVEEGVEPAPTTRYRVVGGQVELAVTAQDRGGIQPVTELRVDRGLRADISSGQTATFTFTAEVPSGAGEIVLVEWDDLGIGDFPVKEDIDPPRRTVALERSVTYHRPGSYFPVVRVTSHRDGRANSAHFRVQNLARVRVVVS